jgi:hypothetical protein
VPLGERNPDGHTGRTRSRMARSTNGANRCREGSSSRNDRVHEMAYTVGDSERQSASDDVARDRA